MPPRQKAGPPLPVKAKGAQRNNAREDAVTRVAATTPRGRMVQTELPGAGGSARVDATPDGCSGDGSDAGSVPGRSLAGGPEDWCACSDYASSGLPCPTGTCPNRLARTKPVAPSVKPRGSRSGRASSARQGAPESPPRGAAGSTGERGQLPIDFVQLRIDPPVGPVCDRCGARRPTWPRVAGRALCDWCKHGSPTERSRFRRRIRGLE